MQMASQVQPDHKALFISAVSRIKICFALYDADSITGLLWAILETEKYRARQASNTLCKAESRNPLFSLASQVLYKQKSLFTNQCINSLLFSNASNGSSAGSLDLS